MKINNKIFRDFMLKRVDTSPNSETTTLNTTDSGSIKMEALEPTNIMMSSHILNKSTITDITKMKDLSINNMARFDKVIKTFDSKGDINITINEATMQLDTGKESHILCLVDKEIATEQIIPIITFDTFFKLKLDYIKDIKKIAETFNDPIAITFIYENKKLHYEVEENGESTISTPIPVITNSTEGKQVLKISITYFMKIVNLLTEDITFYIKTDYPLQIKESTAFMDSTYILAPRVEDDDVEPLEKAEQTDTIEEGDTNDKK